MKVFSIVDKTTQQKTRPNGRSAAKRAKKKEPQRPPRQNLTADQIRSRVAEQAKKNAIGKTPLKEKLKQFEKEKLPDLDDAEKRIVGDVGKNSPDDLATHGKLKKVLSMNAFNFNERERAALEKILIKD